MDIMTTDLARAQVRELQEICSSGRIDVSSLANLASCYFTLGEPERALPLALQAWNHNRKDAGFGTNLAMIYKDLGMHEESFRTIEIAYWNNPDDFYTRLAYAEALLKAGFWTQAWALYDNARPTQLGAAQDLKIPANIPEWDGKKLPEGHKLLVINEGGTGDRLSYPRWLPKLTEMGIDWVFYPYAELYPLFERIFPPERLVKDNDSITMTHWTTTFSLPAKLNVSPREIPPPLRFVPLPDRAEKYKINRPENDKRLVVGLCYKAAELFQGGRTVRSLNPAQAMRIRCQTGDLIHWVNLQYGEKLDYPAINPEINDWEDTCALISELDAVVTVDTGVMHMAGGLNKPTAVLLSSNACWKFLKGDIKKLPWYPSAKFYRNEGHGHGFEHAINELVVAIRNGSAFEQTETNKVK